MQDLKGKIEHSGNSYAWWAGDASPDAQDEYAVHCRRGHFGVTQYLTEQPDQSKAEEVARQLASKVDQLA